MWTICTFPSKMLLFLNILWKTKLYLTITLSKAAAHQKHYSIQQHERPPATNKTSTRWCPVSMNKALRARLSHLGHSVTPDQRTDTVPGNSVVITSYHCLHWTNQIPPQVITGRVRKDITFLFWAVRLSFHTVL